MTTLEASRAHFRSVFPQQLSRLVKASELSLQQIADGVGITKQHIIRLKNGKSLPSAILLLALAWFFDIDPDYFYSPLETISEEVLDNIRAAQG